MFRVSCFAFLVSCLCGSIKAQDDPADLLKSAKPATAPATLTSPDAPEFKPTSDALGTIKAATAPADSRQGQLTLSNGITLAGPIWTTLQTPLRVWVDNDKSYHDIDLSLIKRIDVNVLSQTMEDDWRWLKEGSDQKIYSGKKYPNIELAYTFILLNDQSIQGTIDAPIYIADGDKIRSLALYKKYRGNLDQTLADLVYIKSISFNPSPENTTRNEKTTTKLPLLD